MCLPVVSDVSGKNHVMVLKYGNVIVYTIKNTNKLTTLLLSMVCLFDRFFGYSRYTKNIIFFK